jgi:hypothetical protein
MMLCAMAMIGCATSDTTDSSGQSICNPDIDDCPGGHPITLRQQALIEIADAAASIGVSSQENPTSGCNASGTTCWARWRLAPNLELSTGCGTSGCGTSLCVRDTACGDCWTCTPVPH